MTYNSKNQNTKTHGGGEAAPDLSSPEAIEAYLKEKGATITDTGTENDFVTGEDDHYWRTDSCPRCSTEESTKITRQHDGTVSLDCDRCKPRSILGPTGGDVTIYDPGEAERLHEAEMASLTTSKGQAQAEQLVVLAGDLDLFHTPRGEAYAAIPHGGGREAVNIDGSAFSGYLKKLYYEELGRPPNTQALSDATGLLAARARYDGAEKDVHVRVAEYEGAIYIDLADADGRAIRVRPEGWDIVDNPPVAFRRTSSMRPLPEPEPGQTPGEGLTRLERYVRTPLYGLVLASAFLVQAFRQHGPFPLLVLQGEQGTGKSFTSRLLRALVDPSEVPIRSAPGGEHDLVLAAENEHLIVLDNLSGISPAMSDALCRLATGGGFATRKLYSGREEERFYVQRPVILNGIEALATRPDLGDRALAVELLPIPPDERQPESVLVPAFERDRPAILGGLLDALSASLRYRDDVTLDALPRMADFAVNAEAAARAFPEHFPSFVDAYEASRQAAVDEAIAASPVATAVVGLLEARPRAMWEGTMGELQAELRAYLPDPSRLPRDYPRTAQAMSGALRRVEPALRAVGVRRDAMPREGPSGRRVFRLVRTTTDGGSE